MTRTTPASLYRRLLGESFDALPLAVQALHGSPEGVRAFGRCDVRRGKSMISRFIASLLGAPKAADAVELKFRIVTTAQGEEWVRHFGDYVMHSHFWETHGRLHERLGPVTMQYSLELENGRLHTRLHRLWILRIPVPRALHPRIAAVAHQEGDRYRFDVAAEMPLIGFVVSYCGHLQVVKPGDVT